MNAELDQFARSKIKEGLAKLPAANHRVFKQMYSHENLDADIGDVVDSIPSEKLDWVMKQVRNSLDQLDGE